MPSKVPTHLENVKLIRDRMIDVLSGMETFIDVTTDSESWSIRDIIYHLSDTPTGGLGELFQGMISKTVLEFDLTPDLTNVTPNRENTTLEDGRSDLIYILDRIESIVSQSTPDILENTTIICHHLSRKIDEVRSLENLLRGLFARHWIAHLDQLESLKQQRKK